MSDITDREIRGFTPKLLIATLIGTISITSSILYGVQKIDKRMSAMQTEFRMSTDSIKAKQDIRSLVTDYNFTEIRRDIKDIKQELGSK